MIGEEEAQMIAKAYLEPRSGGITFKFGSTPQRRLDDWTMVFDRITASGSVIDGPVVVLVDKKTGRARTLEEDIEERILRG